MRGLIFDVDGVLGDSEGLSERASVRVFKERYGIDVNGEDFRAFIGTGPHRYMQGVAEKYGVDIDVEEAIDLRQEFYVELLAGGVDIGFPGTHALIEAARQSPDWKLAIATSSPRNKATATLHAARVDTDWFDVLIYGDMVTHKKPDPEIYLTAMAALGLSADDCVVIEDAITGIQAAKAAGCACLAVTNSFGGHELAQADRVVDSLEGITLADLGELLIGE
ncbi:MAG: HAD-IA family hydrolase [Candidatus Hydrogenedens sp.]|nr:HAD-IA family hydrolase [Candidatus Hydrogenedens sp.]